MGHEAMHACLTTPRDFVLAGYLRVLKCVAAAPISSWSASNLQHARALGVAALRCSSGAAPAKPPRTPALSFLSVSSAPSSGARALRASSKMPEGDIDITFDEDNRIRVMPKEKYKTTEELEQQCQAFTERIQQFGGTVQTLVEVLDGEAQKIEYEKLRAIGQRNRAEMEAESRRRKQQQMQAMIAEKTAELERVVFQFNTLERAEREQKTLIEKLSNNEC